MRRISMPHPGPFPSLSQPDIPGITFNKDTGWAFHGAPDNMNFALPFGTVGGDMFHRVAEFTDAHYDQKDTSLNKLIWGELPLTRADVEKLEQDTDDNLRALLSDGDTGVFEPHLLQARVSAFEATRTKACLGVLLRLLRGADAEHLPAGIDPALLFLQKSQAYKFESLTDAINRTERLIDVIDKVYTAQRKFAAAAARYALAILELYPWVNSPVIFTSDKAFESIAPISHALWGRLAECCVSQTQELFGTHDGAATSWAQDALRVAQLSASERFTTRGNLFRAFEVMSIVQVLSVAPAERRAWAGDACSSAQAEAKLRDGQALMKITWASLFLLAEIRTHCKRGETWAHADCLIGHSCGTYGNFINFMKWQPAQTHVHLISQAAVHYDPRPCGWKNGLPFYCELGAHGACTEAPEELILASAYD